MSARRDVAVFLLAALVPAGAVGVLGLRALRNEDAALRREAALEVGREAERAAREVESSLDRATAALSELQKIGARADDPASVERAMAAARAQGSPFGEVVVLSADGRILAPKTLQAGPPADVSPGCRAALDRLPARDRGDVETLLSCTEAQDDLGRWVWPVLALGELRAAPTTALAERLALFFETHGQAMRPAERSAARAEVAALSGLAPAVVERMERALDGAAATSGPLLATIGKVFKTDTAARALAAGGEARRFADPGALGVVAPLGEGASLGLVITPETLARALAAEPPPIVAAPGVLLEVATEAPPSAGERVEAVVFVTEGLGVRARLAHPEHLEARSRRSVRVVGVLSASSALLAVALAGLLFGRMRAARRTSELRTSFVAAVSHELRTPIASLRMLSELLLEDRVEPAERREVLEALSREARRMGDTVERFMTFARMERGQLTARRVAEDLAEILRDRVSAFRTRRPGVEVVAEAPEALPARVDRAQIELVIDNLLENAARHAPGGQPYRVSLARVGGAVELSVADSGPGVPRASRERIFRAFERGDARLSKATEGLGLGLALVRSAARAHGGDVELAGDGPGARFVVRIPAEPRDPAEAERDDAEGKSVTDA